MLVAPAIGIGHAVIDRVVMLADQSNEPAIMDIALGRAERPTLPAIGAVRFEHVVELVTICRADCMAQRESDRERLGAMIMRCHSIFMRDHKTSATREQGFKILEEIDSQVDDTPQSDGVSIQIHGIRRHFKLNDDPSAVIELFQSLAERLADLRLPMNEADNYRGVATPAPIAPAKAEVISEPQTIKATVAAPEPAQVKATTNSRDSPADGAVDAAPVART